MRINSRIADSFKWKFGRDPKKRSISELHALYKRAQERSITKRKQISDLIDRIVKETPLVKQQGEDRHIVYFNMDDKIYKYEFTYRSEYKSWAYSWNSLKFEGDTQSKREQKINFFLSNDIAFELGEKFHKLDKGQKNLEYKVKHVLIDEISEELRKKFNKVNAFDTPSVIPVKVNDETLIFNLDGQSFGLYKKFNFIGFLSEELSF